MNTKNISINVEYLTRVEGHGNIVVDVKDGNLKTCRLDIVESPRFIEGMLRGRSIFEAQAYNQQDMRYMFLRTFAGIDSGRRGCYRI